LFECNEHPEPEPSDMVAAGKSQHVTRIIVPGHVL
jgi:hypothetical protein